MKKKILVEIVAFLFMLLFFYAAFNKLAEYQKFRIQVGQSPLLTGFGSVIPPGVIGVEIVTGVMLMVPALRLAALYISFSLMVMFSVYIIAILNFSPYVPCSCGGVLEKLSWSEHLVFNVVFVLVAVLGIWLESLSQIDGAFPLDRADAVEK